MRRISIRRFRSVGALVGAMMGLVGCYTIVNHPKIAPEEQVTDRGDVIGRSECVGCHSEAELWSFHYGTPWLARSHSPFYYHPYDRYVLSRRWWSDEQFYRRWVLYYRGDWWGYYYPSPAYAGGGAGWTPKPPAIGRGAERDSANSSEPRFVPLGGVGPGPMPMFSTGLPVAAAGSASSSARADSTAKPSYDGGRPVRVEPRYPDAQQPSSPPVAPSESSGGSASQQKQADDQKDDKDKDKESDQPRGRGDDRDGGSSRSR